ncbi:DUF996 domain-containing protein [Pyrococcus sp. ST04]|uniref:DUF996 domain-containing protein n=1 Tax=Pyrococcus sp. ST04 TaxID=1183377 RepID=UPI0002605ED4|nr:DUF996 domain-containing protein [Pyrococcus sp. ST04]AFK23224.1 hypothetical protein Py04_1654 [Pyrococcus sp. ST04]
MNLVSIENIKLFLTIGAVLTLVSLIPGVGSLIGLIGAIIYLYGLYKWSQLVDERPLKLEIIAVIIGIFGIAIAAYGLSRVSIALIYNFSFFKILYVFLLFLYPFLVVEALLQKEVLKYFYEATGVNDFLLAGKLVLYGALLLPTVVGGFVAIGGRIVEVMAYNKMPSKVQTIKGKSITIDKQKFLVFPLASLILSYLLVSALLPSYDIVVEDGDLKFFGNIEGDEIRGVLVYEFPCVEKLCITEVRVDGRVVYSGNPREFVNGRQVVHLSMPKTAKSIEVKFWTGDVAVLHLE